MVFKTVDGHITNIFNKVDKLNTGFELTNGEIQDFVDRFNELNSNQSFGQEYTDFIAEMTNRNFNVSQMFSDLAKQGASARASIEGFYAAILDGNTTGFANVKSTITLFNQAQQSGTDNAKAFAKAVSQSNTQLGNYLGGLNGAKASLVGYGTQLAITTAKTIGLRAVTMALNAALSFGVLTVVSLFVSKLDEWIVTQKELTEQTKESADKAKEQAAAFSDLKTQYLAIIDSADDETTKTEKLNEWKNTLIETYGFEKKALESLNTEREKGIELLEQESKAGIKSTYQNYLVENKNEIEKAQKKLGQLGKFNIFTGSQIDVDENADFGVARDEKSRTFSSNSQTSYILLNLVAKQSLDFVLHRLSGVLVEVDTDDIGRAVYLLSDGGCGVLGGGLCCCVSVFCHSIPPVNEKCPTRKG